MFGPFVISQELTSSNTTTTTTPSPTTNAPAAAGPVRKIVRIRNLRFKVIRRVMRNGAGGTRKVRKNRNRSG